MKFDRRIIIPGVLVMLVFAAAAFAVIKCDLCGKNISGDYYRGSDQKNYCADCYSKYTVCASCGKLSKSVLPAGDQKFCPDCYFKLKKCHLCGETITGSYIYYPDLKINICDKCEKTKKRCQGCGRPAKNLELVGGAYLCDVCSSRAARCFSCGTALLKDYKFYEGDETRKYCDDCVSKYESCADCGAPSGPNGSRLDDDRYLCPVCRDEALFSPGQITPVKESTFDFLEKQLGIKVKHKAIFTLQDKKFLEKKSRGLSKDINGLFVREGDSFNIYVLYGLRRKDLIWVLAHEITHAWQSENCSENLSIIDREGFAQWTAYHAARNWGHKKYAENMKLGDSVYSRGLNKMLDIENERGRAGVISYILNE